MEGHLQGAILLAILLTCLGALWRHSRQPQLAFPIFSIALVIPIVAVNILAFVLLSVIPQYGILDEHPVSDRLITFLTHQAPILLACLAMLLYGLQWTRRGKRLLIGTFLVVSVLACWHFIRLSEFDRYRVAGTALMGRREKARCTPNGSCPASVWHTWLSGLEWDPDPRPYMNNNRQLVLAVQMYMQAHQKEAAPEALPAAVSSPESRRAYELWGNISIKELRLPASLQNARLHASLNAAGLLLVIVLTLLMLILTPWRAIRWWEEKWRFAFAPALFLLLAMATSHLWLSHLSRYSPSIVTQWLIPSICLGIMGAVLQIRPRLHAAILAVALVLAFGIDFHAMLLYKGTLGSGIFTSEFKNHSSDRIMPVNAWHNWLTGIRFEG